MSHQEPSLGVELATAASPQRNPYQKFSDRLIAKGCTLPFEDAHSNEKKLPSAAETHASFGEVLESPNQKLLSWPHGEMESATKLSEECSTDTIQADDFFKSFIRDAQAKESEANLAMPLPPSPPTLPPLIDFIEPTGMQDPEYYTQDPTLPGLAGLGTFCNWGMGGTGDTADVDMDMSPGEDEVDLQMEAMVEDLAGAESFTWRNRRQLVEDAFTKVDAARTALSKVLTCGGSNELSASAPDFVPGSLSASAQDFVPGQMWMNRDEGESSSDHEAMGNVPR